MVQDIVDCLFWLQDWATDNSEYMVDKVGYHYQEGLGVCRGNADLEYQEKEKNTHQNSRHDMENDSILFG